MDGEGSGAEGGGRSALVGLEVGWVAAEVERGTSCGDLVDSEEIGIGENLAVSVELGMGEDLVVAND